MTYPPAVNEDKVAGRWFTGFLVGEGENDAAALVVVEFIINEDHSCSMRTFQATFGEHGQLVGYVAVGEASGSVDPSKGSFLLDAYEVLAPMSPQKHADFQAAICFLHLSETSSGLKVLTPLDDRYLLTHMAEIK